MSESRQLLQAHFALADAIKEQTGWIVEEESAIDVIIKALNRALSPERFRVLQYLIQREDAPEDLTEKAWVDARRLQTMDITQDQWEAETQQGE
jgi:hypothetical protein